LVIVPLVLSETGFPPQAASFAAILRSRRGAAMICVSFWAFLLLPQGPPGLRGQAREVDGGERGAQQHGEGREAPETANAARLPASPMAWKSNQSIGPSRSPTNGGRIMRCRRAPG
jgi:hypothetical protein